MSLRSHHIGDTARNHNQRRKLLEGRVPSEPESLVVRVALYENLARNLPSQRCNSGHGSSSAVDRLALHETFSQRSFELVKDPARILRGTCDAAPLGRAPPAPLRQRATLEPPPSQLMLGAVHEVVLHLDLGVGVYAALDFDVDAVAQA